MTETHLEPDTQFSKARIETLCDGIFAIAMTLLVLELKVPDLPRPAAAADVWHALGAHWTLAKQQGLLSGAATDPKRHRFAVLMLAFPLVFGLLFVVSVVQPRSAGIAAIPAMLVILIIRRIAEKRAHTALTS